MSTLIKAGGVCPQGFDLFILKNSGRHSLFLQAQPVSQGRWLIHLISQEVWLI